MLRSAYYEHKYARGNSREQFFWQFDNLGQPMALHPASHTASRFFQLIIG